MIQVSMDLHDAQHTIEALLLAAELEAVRNPSLARRYRAIADSFGDGLDRSIPAPSDGSMRDRKKVGTCATP